MISRLKKIWRFIQKHFIWFFIPGMAMLLIASEGYEPQFTIVSIFLIVTLLFWGIRWLVNQVKLIINLKTEKTKTELLHLQSQVNPHFFFNTLNNLYGSIDKDNEKARNMVLKLSDMMRYSIYEGQNEWVIIEKEVDYLNNYIELHKSRYHKKIDIQFNHHIQNEGCKVMPLLFIILLENAFKHGVENLREHAYVYINLIVNNDGIHFGIENNFDPEEESDKGIGLKNLKRRLELVYPDKHSLSLSVVEDIYKAQLSLKL